ncbi:MAG: sigma-E processing peptidase SpoIIGA [Syntrophomonadaceae bacterium]|nr:sigma-E processing peptidase SpoIIGA [Syntrophomonadaceae bacterium]
MGQSYVYLDVVFLINLVMDYTILWATARFGQIPASNKRLLAGAFVGALYCIALLVPGLTFLYGLLFRVVLSLVIVGVAFAPLSLRKFLQALGYFYLIAFTMGGAILGGIYLLSTNPQLFGTVNRLLQVLVNIPFGWLLVGVAAAVVLGKWGTAIIRRALIKTFYRVPLTICVGGQNLTLPALLDTGNQLKDPLTKAPVVIAEYSAVEPFLPDDLKDIFQRSPDLDLKKAAEELSGSEWSNRFRLIPFSSIGKHHGMLLGLRPDEVSIVVDDRKVTTQNVVVGIYNKPLCPEGSYRALLHPDLLGSAMTA